MRTRSKGTRIDVPLSILFLTSEYSPLATTGGLGDVSAALPRTLAGMGHHVRIVMPFYRSIREDGSIYGTEEEALQVPFRGELLRSEVYFNDVVPNLRINFIRRDEFFDRSQLYGSPDADYFDNAERFIFFSRAALSLGRSLGFRPDIIHCNDWQTGLVPVYLKSLHQNDPAFQETGVVFTIHNLAYQGIFPPEIMEVAGLPPALFSMAGLEFYGNMNFMKGGIIFSERVNTVSPKYAQEIQTKAYGYGLDGVLRERRKDLVGILNGVDYSLWDPASDPHIASNFTAADLSGKKACKVELMKIFKLDGPGSFPILGIVSRLAGQKGIDILAGAVESLLELKVFFVLLGSGEDRYKKEFAKIGRAHKGRVGVRFAYDNVLARKIEAGADLFLMPSRYEPCGLNQMYSLKYGTIPVVRATGGLDDTIQEFDAKTGEGNGFKFSAYTSKALVMAVKRAIRIYGKKDLWTRLVSNAMASDFSWAKSAAEYVDLYRNAKAAVGPAGN